MVDYQKMYALMDEAASASLDILSANSDEQSVNWVRFLLRQATIRANHIYTITQNGNYAVEGTHE